ncbi:MAG: S-adenosylhomocysteine/5'-methylthioadenosine nucleosidase [Nitrospirae bacterium]|nr:MAG: S-adenosylhomocysteine/5'-methylthioadenosine nucleosidase [Nitrospirota bacterium]
MIRTGLIVSTPFECAGVLTAITHKQIRSIAEVNFISGRLSAKNRDEPVTICISGVGKTNAARAATLLIEHYRPARLILFGVGGAYPSSDLGIGDIVVADRESYGDEGLRMNNGFRDMADLGLPLFLSRGKTFHNSFPLSVPKKLRQRCRAGGFVTVSACTGTLAEGLRMERRWSAVCENMEGAAVAHIGRAHGVVLTEIRSISNIIEDRSGAPLNKADLQQAASAMQHFFLDAWRKNVFS